LNRRLVASQYSRASMLTWRGGGIGRSVEPTQAVRATGGGLLAGKVGVCARPLQSPAHAAAFAGAVC
jgi:hypothetical protein